MKRLSLNSDGAFRTTIHRRTPHAKNNTSTTNRKRMKISRIINFLWCYNDACHIREVKVWSHQSVLQRNALRLSAVRPTMTSGGDTKVRTRRATLTNPHNNPSFFISEASVIFTAFAERTRNITEILERRESYC